MKPDGYDIPKNCVELGGDDYYSDTSTQLEEPIIDELVEGSESHRKVMNKLRKSTAWDVYCKSINKTPDTNS